MLIVVAPLQVLGAGLLDELIAPTAYRVFDAAKYSKLNPTPSDEDKASEREGPGTRRMVGTDPDAIEAWAFDPLALEALLKRLVRAQARAATVGRRALFVGERDELLDQRQPGARAHRAVHRQRLQERHAVVHRRGRSRAVVRAAHGPLRMSARSAWAGTVPTTRRSCSRAGTVSPTRRRFCAASCSNSPMLMPTFGWPEGTTVDPAKLPDWSWRLKPTLDVRQESERPPPGATARARPGRDARAIDSGQSRRAG